MNTPLWDQVGFSQPTYLCEYETAWRNNALLYFMQEAGVFDKGANPEEVLDFYIQVCCRVLVCLCLCVFDFSFGVCQCGRRSVGVGWCWLRVLAACLVMFDNL